MTVFYNDIDKGSIAWLQRLMGAGLIPEGKIDNRSIADIAPNDLEGVHRSHFFAGIAGWELALQLAGWPENVGVWTGSCPCQPFSCAGKRKGAADERHLWPELRRLIDECRPTVVFGEQVSGKDGRIWLDGISSDLETLGFGIWAVDTCSAGVGSPNIRQRLYWVAYRGNVERLGYANEDECPGQQVSKGLQGEQASDPHRTGAACGLGGSIKSRLERYSGDGSDRDQSGRNGAEAHGSAPKTSNFGFWSNYRIIKCKDGKVRRIPETQSIFQPVASGIPNEMVSGFPLAPRIKNRSRALAGIGNAINVRVAAELIGAFMDVIGIARGTSHAFM